MEHVRPHRDDRLVDGAAACQRRSADPDRTANRQHHALHSGQAASAGADGGSGRTLHRRRRFGARLFGAARPGPPSALFAHPFEADPAARLYNTGDLARYLPDGTVEVLGRTDHQVKIRGFRIELGEIETALARHPGVAEAVVVARDDGRGALRLLAYLAAAGESAPQSGELRVHLRNTLPDYMVPAAFVVLDKLPRTPNGKVDRSAARPGPESAEPRDGYVPPRFACSRRWSLSAAAALLNRTTGRHHRPLPRPELCFPLLAPQMVSQVRMNARRKGPFVPV